MNLVFQTLLFPSFSEVFVKVLQLHDDTNARRELESAQYLLHIFQSASDGVLDSVNPIGIQDA